MPGYSTSQAARTAAAVFSQCLGIRCVSVCVCVCVCGRALSLHSYVMRLGLMPKTRHGAELSGFTQKIGE